jgi:1,4-dihydroxy-2-naphthoate octaprenyltransferase
MFLLGLVPIIAEEKGTLKDHLKEMGKKLFQGVLRGAAALVLLFVSVYFGRLIIFPLIIGFSLAAYAQRVLYKHQKDRDFSEKQEANKKTRK